MQIKGIRIFENAYKNIILDLKDILCLIDNGESYSWTVFALEATLSINASEEGRRIYEAITNSENGCNLTWSELNIFSQNVFQVMDGYFLATWNHEALQIHFEEFDELEIIKKCNIAIIMNDSYYWDIYTKDQNFYNRIINNLKIDKHLEIKV